MKLTILLVGAVVAAAAATPATLECVPGKPTTASYRWDFQGEANALFQDIQIQAAAARDNADTVQSYADRPISWGTHAAQLNALKAEVNRMGKDLCRLETIRRVTTPWQQAEIDRIAGTLPLMANSTQDAILFGRAHQNALWMPPYEMYANNIRKDAASLQRSTDDAVAYARAAKKYRDLRQDLGMKPAS